MIALAALARSAAETGQGDGDGVGSFQFRRCLIAGRPFASPAERYNRPALRIPDWPASND